MVPYINIDHPFHLKNDLKFAFTYCNETASIGSSVCSGLRNSLLSSFSSLSYDFDDGMIDRSSSSEGSEEDFIDQRVAQDFPSWRLSPEESKSDWTIVVESVPEGTISEYHVHKEVLIHNGRKSSDYFSRIFGDILNQKVYKYKTIKIHEDAAKLIETMLDYMYSVQDRLLLTSESAVGLRHLSQFFGIEALAKRVSAFIREDIELSNMDIYMDTTAAFDDLETIMLCADRCAEEIEDIHPLSQMVVEMDPSFVLAILSSEKFDRAKNSKHMSHIMTGYFISQQGVIDGHVFEELTAEEYLPTIDQEAAFPLLILEGTLVKDSNHDDHDVYDNDPNNLSSLQVRCIDALLPLFRPGLKGRQSAMERGGIRAQSRRSAMQRVPKKVLVHILGIIAAEEVDNEWVSETSTTNSKHLFEKYKGNIR